MSLGQFVLAAVALTATAAAADPAFDTLEQLGGALFADRNLSISTTQSCISCHSPNLAFTDPRTLGEVNGAVSRGADRKSLGDRNAPTILYSALTPDFSIEADGRPRGGFFHDGRATTLEQQAGMPLLDPLEMAMPDKAALAARIKQNTTYTVAFRRLFGEGSLDHPQQTFAAIEQALAAFLRTPAFATFDSRYDRYLKKEAPLSERELSGRGLFFGGAGCAACHSSGDSARDTFTGYRYFNLGVPTHHIVRAANGSQRDRVDRGVATFRSGLGSHHEGKFKTPTLRNVAVTGPYMHNGVVEDLRTAILLHNRFSALDGPVPRQTRPTWDVPEMPQTVDREILAASPLLTDPDLDALIAFLGTLTDARYEPLLPQNP